MPRSAREQLRPIVEDAHEAVVRARDEISRGAAARTVGPGVEERARRLGEVGFTAPESAKHFEALCAILFGAGSTDETVVDLFAACLSGASPDAALLNLRRYLDNAGGVSVFMSTIVGARPLLEMVTAVFGASQYLSDIIIRNPSTVYWLMENDTWTTPDTVEHLVAWFSREASMFTTGEAKLDAVRRAHRQALLKIGIADLVHGESVEGVTRRLSNLADAVATVVLRLVMEEVGGVVAEDRGIAVIAMGKLGGGELNYSSDIDLIYVCEDNDDETIALYTRAAKRYTDALSELTSEGYFYRVDLRLRPDGKAGPLVNTESALRVYYENRGRPWEFQAMLKARVVAGNHALGERVLGVIAGLVFNPTLPYAPLDDIARMRGRIKESVPARARGANIKLMAGGIRDIEFVAQTLQLLHGQQQRSLRTPNTLEALEQISRLELLEGWQVDNLGHAYRFFRLVEHRLQMMHQLKTHTVPESMDEIALLARRVSKGPLGTYTTDEFLDALSKHINNVRTFADSFFSGEDVHPHSILLMLPEGDERASAIIGQYGIRDVNRAMRVLHTMAYGSFPRLLDRSARAAFERLLPHLLEGIAAMGDPDRALVQTSQIATAGRSEASFYRLLVESPPARDLVLAIAGLSSLLTRRLCAQIGVLDSLMQAADETAEALRSAAIPARDRFDAADAAAGGDRAAARQARQRAWFDRARLVDFVLNLRGNMRPFVAGLGRSWMAQRHLVAALDDAVGPQPVAMFVLGSYAVDEPRLHSDADVIVVSDGADIPAVTERVQSVNGWFTDGQILKLDFRLRGEGASAPLVQDLGYYESYLEKRMSLWERIALAKCRAWWGDEAVQRRFMTGVRRAVARPFTRDEIATLATMRHRVEALAPARFTAWETKRSAGGRYDVEYLTAIAMAQHAGDDPDFFTMSTRERVERVAASGALSDGEADECIAALDTYSTVEYLMELQDLNHPASAEKAEYLGRYLERTFAFLGIPADGGVEAVLARHKAAVRRCYESVLGRLT